MGFSYAASLHSKWAVGWERYQNLKGILKLVHDIVVGSSAAIFSNSLRTYLRNFLFMFTITVIVSFIFYHIRTSYALFNVSTTSESHCQESGGLCKPCCRYNFEVNIYGKRAGSTYLGRNGSTWLFKSCYLLSILYQTSFECFHYHSQYISI